MGWRAVYRLCVLTVGLIAAVLFVARDARAAEIKRIIVIHSFGRDFKPWNEYAINIRTELDRQSRWKLEIHDHSLLPARGAEEDPHAAFAEYLSVLYAQSAPDLIISVGAPAANFVQRFRKRLFPATPMVFTAVEQRRVQWANLTPNDVVVAAAHNFPAIFETILRVLPATKTIVVVNGASPNEKYWLGELQRETRHLQEKVNFLWYENASFEEILGRAAALPPHSAIFWHLMNVDAAGVSHEGDNTLARLYEVANAPIFSHNDTFFGREIVGGPMHSVAEGSRQTAAVAMRILDGESPADIKIAPHGYATPKYDSRLLRRWSIDEKLLPFGSTVLSRVPSIWETYRWQIGVISATVLVQALLITGLLYERRQRQVAQLQSRQRMTELAHVNRQSVAGELAASISHELNQPLGAILSNVETAELMIGVSPPDVNELTQILADIKRDDHRASEVLRRLRSLLRKSPFELKAIDLNDVVRDTVEFVLAVARMRGVSLSTSLASVRLSIKGDAVQLQQVIMNLMLNAADAMANKPSQQRQIEIRTERVEDMAELSVRDTGPGISPGKLKDIFEPFFSTKEAGMGMGLSIARTIVEAHNGTISVKNRTEGGAIFRIKLPIA